MFEIELFGHAFRFEADAELFSPCGVDRGTLAMMRSVHPHAGDKIMDLGCGYGIVGIVFAKLLGESGIFMVDVSDSAVRSARENALRNGVAGVTIIQGSGPAAFADRDFNWILSNPPYHADFSVPKAFVEQGFTRLALGGRMVMVVKRLDWYRNKLAAVFGGVSVREEDGYFVLAAEKRRETRGPVGKPAATTRKHRKKMEARR